MPSSAKETTARNIVKAVQEMAPLNDLAPDVWQLYWDVTASEGAYTDEDLEPLGIDVATLTDCVTLLEAVKNLFANQPVAQNTYRVTVNKVRHLGF